MRRKEQTSPILIQHNEDIKTRARVRRGAISTNPNRRKMTVSVSESFEDIHDMNQKALKILAKRA